jgi:hypothetical protein
MTKSVRIENACNSNYKVQVCVYEKGHDGAPDQLIEEIFLNYPTAMTSNLYLTSSRYFIVKELP